MSYYVGVDVSKLKHTVSIIDDKGEIIEKSFDINNTRQGFNELLNRLSVLMPKDAIFIGMEATGHYMRCLARMLINHQYHVEILNPSLIVNFRNSIQVSKAKTDKLDAFLIARYMQCNAFAPSQVLSNNIERLRKLTHAKSFFMKDRTKCFNHLHRYLDETFPELIDFMKTKDDGSKKAIGKNLFEYDSFRWLIYNYPSANKVASMRIESGEKLRKLSRGRISAISFIRLKEAAKNSIGYSTEEDELIIKSLIEEVETIDKKLSIIDKSIKEIMSEINSPILSIPGIGLNLAATIIAEIGDIHRFSNPEKLIKFAGLDVNIYQSGTILKVGRIRKCGSSLLRYALTLSVQKLRIHSPVFADFYSKKIAEGKRVTVALIATARKLLRVIWKLMTTNQQFVAE